MPGIFITKGMTFSISQFSIHIRDDGEIESDPVTPHVRFDVCPTWIEIAKRHLESAIEARTLRQTVWLGTDTTAKAKALELEFESSMQAIMAAAIAWDAIYSILRQHVNIPQSFVDKWRAGRTARYSQVTEIVRRAFALKPKNVAALRSNLKEIYRYRDLAVHPSGKIEAPLLHPELDVGVEWRFVYFRATNAELAVSGSTAMLWELAHNGQAKDPKIVEYQKSLCSRLEEIFPAGPPTIPLIPTDTFGVKAQN
jgi:hypothetical protein